MELKSLCVYCGSNPGASPAYVDAARGFGELLAREGVRLIYGGGRTGLMGAVADGALAAGGSAVGVIPRALIAKEVAHQHLTELQVVESMHERKLTMAGLADAFVALPGGIGTLEELTEVFTWTQLGIHLKPCGLLNTAGFYDELTRFFATMSREKFLMAEHLDTLLIESEGPALLARIRAAHLERIDKWYDRATPAQPNPTE